MVKPIIKVLSIDIANLTHPVYGQDIATQLKAFKRDGGEIVYVSTGVLPAQILHQRKLKVENIQTDPPALRDLEIRSNDPKEALICLKALMRIPEGEVKDAPIGLRYYRDLGDVKVFATYENGHAEPILMERCGDEITIFYASYDKSSKKYKFDSYLKEGAEVTYNKQKYTVRAGGVVNFNYKYLKGPIRKDDRQRVVFENLEQGGIGGC